MVTLNEEVDGIAKQAAKERGAKGGERLLEASDVKARLKSICKEKRRDFIRELAAAGSATCLHYIEATDGFQNRPLNWGDMPRGICTALAQLATGHCSRATGIWGGVEYLQDQTCPRCQETGVSSIKHVLFHCPATKASREALVGAPDRQVRKEIRRAERRERRKKDAGFLLNAAKFKYPKVPIRELRTFFDRLNKNPVTNFLRNVFYAGEQGGSFLGSEEGDLEKVVCDPCSN
jgi:hypothetical protein